MLDGIGNAVFRQQIQEVFVKWIIAVKITVKEYITILVAIVEVPKVAGKSYPSASHLNISNDVGV
jgi:hypothetical protein